ncbi:FGL1-like protein [Mya arenaria]|uniref:FGL1-like protein n=1 Tax=Mya arenaria TaxID=6604 RepID=A0ABY7G6D1_MYAAR|nr:FGL1-like protein [Mya arenaria]
MLVRPSMILLRPFAIAALVILATCEEDRLRKLEGQMIEMKAFQSYVMAFTVPGVTGLHGPIVTRAAEVDKADCSDVLKLGLSRGSGVYKITPWNTHKEVEVYCDMDTEGGGWTVFQRRYDGSVAFNRSFVDYERGFGSLDGEFWTGLGLLYTLTSRANMTLRIDMSLPDGTTGFDEYSGFYISPPDRYNFNVDRRMNSERMTNSYLLSDNSSRWDINHQPFSTYDRDVDNWFGNNCALRHGGGWWFNECMTNNLNGPYNSDVQDRET